MEGYPLKDLELAEALQGEIFVGLFVVGVVADGTTLVGVLFTGVEGPLNATFCAHVTGNGSCLLRTAFKRGGGGLEKDDRLEPEALVTQGDPGGVGD